MCGRNTGKLADHRRAVARLGPLFYADPAASERAFAQCPPHASSSRPLIAPSRHDGGQKGIKWPSPARNFSFGVAMGVNSAALVFRALFGGRLLPIRLRVGSNYLAVFVGPRISRYGRVAHTNSNNTYDGMRPACPMYCIAPLP